ncbi:MAG: glycosyltransferase family 39 protein [Blastocatellia bacterium]
MPHWAPLLLCLLHFLVLASLARQHPFGTFATETDFYHYYAPDAERLAAGAFPQNTYQGPGYPAALALAAKLTGRSGDLFTVGKWLSVACAVAVGGLIFTLFARIFGARVGAGAQIIAVSSGELPQFSIQAGTDLFFLLLVLIVLALFLGQRWPAHWRIAAAGALTGAAYLTRYNGLFLLAACMFGILFLDLFERSPRRRMIACASFLAFFLLAASPWLYANWRHHGSPLYNTNYLNMATEFYPELVGGKVNQDATRALDPRFDSFGDVLRYDPKRMLAQYPLNLWESLRLSARENLVAQFVAWMGWLGALMVLWERQSKPTLLLLVAGGLYLLLMGLNHWETRYYFFITALYAGLAVHAATRWLALARARGWLRSLGFDAVPAAIVALMLLMTLSQSRKLVREFLDSHPWEILAARDYLDRENAHGVRIVARKPHLPYLTRNKWVFIPQVETIEELRVWLADHPADYLAIGKRELKEREGLAPLGDPTQAPEWLRVAWVHKNPGFVLYRPLESQK